MMKRATFIDFDDSFTFNVIQELSQAGFTVAVVHWKDFEVLPAEGLLVLGPGPGHPDDYQSLFPLILSWLELKKPLFGVCLGHQLLWRILGEDVIRSKEPLHGQKVKLALNKEWSDWLRLGSEVSVQRYNSLAVLAQAAIRNPGYRNLIVNDEILITRSPQVITYQFHPESVGTSYRKAFFRPVFEELV
ncbi:MAG TPA: hypothetical protein VNJ01_02340 [Bacteriovoracaceae bacterium]|nr:hypothetical protein [Bacteriovoracaceae bacterium]